LALSALFWGFSKTYSGAILVTWIYILGIENLVAEPGVELLFENLPAAEE
jgi:hypothetical protein